MQVSGGAHRNSWSFSSSSRMTRAASRLGSLMAALAVSRYRPPRVLTNTGSSWITRWMDWTFCSSSDLQSGCQLYGSDIREVGFVGVIIKENMSCDRPLQNTRLVKRDYRDCQ